MLHISGRICVQTIKMAFFYWPSQNHVPVTGFRHENLTYQEDYAMWMLPSYLQGLSLLLWRTEIRRCREVPLKRVSTVLLMTLLKFIEVSDAQHLPSIILVGLIFQISAPSQHVWYFLVISVTTGQGVRLSLLYRRGYSSKISLNCSKQRRWDKILQ